MKALVRSERSWSLPLLLVPETTPGTLDHIHQACGRHWCPPTAQVYAHAHMPSKQTQASLLSTCAKACILYNINSRLSRHAPGVGAA